MDNIQQIAARYRSQVEEAQQELSRVQQRIYRIASYCSWPAWPD